MDRHNSELSKRSRPLVGTQIVLGLKPSATPNKWQGQVYNADDGRTYSGDLKMTGPDALEMALRLANHLLEARSFNDGLGNRLPINS